MQVLRNHQQKVKVQKVREIQEGRRRALQEEQQPQKGEQRKEAVLDAPSSFRLSSVPATKSKKTKQPGMPVDFLCIPRQVLQMLYGL